MGAVDLFGSASSVFEMGGAMLDLIAVSLLAVDSVLALYLLHIEVNDPRRRMQRVVARREALRRQESEAKKTGGDTSERN
jgi:hypothetical protein